MYTFGKPNWFDRTCEEHLACREGVAMFDLTSFAKFEIEVTGTKLSSTLEELASSSRACELALNYVKSG